MLNNVKGVTIPFTTCPVQNNVPFPYKLTREEKEAADIEITDFLDKGVIVETEHSEGEFISNIFVRPKPNGESRIILDLTKLNNVVEYEHFKMFSLNTAIDLITPGVWLASVDLKSAYYSVPIATEDRKYLRFNWKDKLYEFTCLPNGLSACPRIFTKILKPIYAKLSEQGVVSFPYIDDSLVVSNTKEHCDWSVKLLCDKMEKAGFTIHKDKSVLQPTTKLKFLGFWLDTVKLEVSLTQDKIDKFTSFARSLLENKERIKIRKVAVLLGLMTAYSQGLKYGQAHIKYLEIAKNAALVKTKGDFEGTMRVPEEAQQEILWWLHNIDGTPRQIRFDESPIHISTDASLEGWGAHMSETTAGGRWIEGEANDHINVLELKAILLALKSLVRNKQKTIRIFTDNTTALAYVRNMGGTKSIRCNDLAKQIWNWAEVNDLWLEIAHIPGKLNAIADNKSRKFKDHLEWSLSIDIFNTLCRIWGTPEVDLFASRINKKLDCYVSWKPEPDSWKIDAFSFTWTDKFYYVFPPFSLVGRVARKLKMDGSRAILIAPLWATQPWTAQINRWATQRRMFPRGENNLQHSGPLCPNGDVSSTPLGAYLFCGRA